VGSKSQQKNERVFQVFVCRAKSKFRGVQFQLQHKRETFSAKGAGFIFSSGQRSRKIIDADH
jgi:hypothetical protein